MAKSIFLKNLYPNTLPEQAFYFYDGRTVVRYGVIEIPADNITWLQRAWGEGYRIDPDTGRVLEMSDVARAAESALSAGETVEEGSDLGRQPAGEHRLRSSELPRDAGIPKPRVGGRVGPRAADASPRNKPTAKAVRA